MASRWSGTASTPMAATAKARRCASAPSRASCKPTRPRSWTTPATTWTPTRSGTPWSPTTSRVAEVEGKMPIRPMSDRYADGIPDRRMLVDAAGGYDDPGQEHAKLKVEKRSEIERGYTVVRKKTGGATIAEALRLIEWIMEVR